jgi:hypothetical protein
MKRVLDSVGDPLEVIRDALIQSERDWDFDESSAVIFAIVCGWHEVLPQVARKFGWSEEQIDRLARLRTRFIALCPLCAELT